MDRWLSRRGRPHTATVLARTGSTIRCRSRRIKLARRRVTLCVLRHVHASRSQLLVACGSHFWLDLFCGCHIPDPTRAEFLVVQRNCSALGDSALTLVATKAKFALVAENRQGERYPSENDRNRRFGGHSNGRRKRPRVPRKRPSNTFSSRDVYNCRVCAEGSGVAGCSANTAGPVDFNVSVYVILRHSCADAYALRYCAIIRDRTRRQCGASATGAWVAETCP